ncbi:GNAT family N-acetyltransferase [Clostridium sp. YIM B02506]|uniref:GNAT family N-acetyltransferase n=1 Tax=Clostridium sp. YIM B02506 TaxID=2910680 RepID=UPI001EEE323C|nr:GNAT family N-acetyltransferase [Clostridium sp. YIM B02506]
MNYEVEKMRSEDWEQVKEIYLQGINTGLATFQNEVPTWEAWDKGHLEIGRLVARSNDEILGWVSIGPTSSRSCYEGVVEVSIYIKAEYRGNGIGTSLLKSLIEQSEENGIWTLYCSIIKENCGSIEMHKKCGFREIGTRERIAKMPNGTWHDVVLLERRSNIAGMI